MTPCERKKEAKGFWRAAKPPRPPARDAAGRHRMSRAGCGRGALGMPCGRVRMALGMPCGCVRMALGELYAAQPEGIGQALAPRLHSIKHPLAPRPHPARHPLATRTHPHGIPSPPARSPHGSSPPPVCIPCGWSGRLGTSPEAFCFLLIYTFVYQWFTFVDAFFGVRFAPLLVDAFFGVRFAPLLVGVFNVCAERKPLYSITAVFLLSWIGVTA